MNRQSTTDYLVLRLKEDLLKDGFDDLTETLREYRQELNDKTVVQLMAELRDIDKDTRSIRVR